MLEVKCVDSSGFEDSISEGAFYPVIEIGSNGYLIVDDEGRERWYGLALRFVGV